jgi:cytoskeletal protein CcmA (bactofilin family)
MADASKFSAAQTSNVGAYLGPGTKINGKLLFEGSATIEGEVEGESTVHGNATIGERATVKGKIAATSILVKGKVMGDIQADRVEIQPPGVVAGDINAQSLIIGDGAIFDGQCSMKKEKEGKVLPLRQEASGGSGKEGSS